MKNRIAAFALSAFILTGCGGPDEPAAIEVETPPEAQTTLPSLTDSVPRDVTLPTSCSGNSISYPLNFDAGETQMTEGTRAALETEFTRLLSVTEACGQVSVAIVQTVFGDEDKALAETRATEIQRILNEDYLIPKFYISSTINEANFPMEGSDVKIDVSFADSE